MMMKSFPLSESFNYQINRLRTLLPHKSHSPMHVYVEKSIWMVITIYYLLRDMVQI